MKNSDQAKIENSEQLMGALIETTSKFQNSIRHELNTSLGTFIAELDVLKYEDTGINQNMIDGLTTSLDQYLNTLIAYDALFREYKDNPDSIPEKVGTDYLINILPKHTRYLKLVADGEKEQQQWIINIAKDATRIPFPSHSLNFFKDLRGGRYAFPLDESNFRSDLLRNYGLLAEELEFLFPPVYSD